MRVLVTGATGFVGSHVARALADRGDDVRVLVRAAGRIDNLTGIRCEIAHGDLTDRASVRRAVEGCDTVYHVAADYRLWSPSPSQLYRVNVGGTLNVMQSALEAGVRRVVYTSTVGVLGIPPGGAAGAETTPVAYADMVGHYKRSKYLAEAEVRRLSETEGLPVVIVNPSTPVGEGDIKPTPTGRIVVDYLNRRMPAYVQTGLNLIDVRDVAAGHLLAAERGIPGERYILGNRNMTLQQILATLAGLTGMPEPRWRIPLWFALGMAYINQGVVGGILGREPRIAIESVRMARKLMYFDASRAVQELGLPQSPVEDALDRAVHWFRRQGYASGA